MNNQLLISFENSEFAFAYKTNNELKKAHFLFSVMGKPFLVKLGLAVIPILIKWRIPFIKTIIKSTIFNQFVGGESLEQTTHVVNKLESHNVNVILDYGVEGVEGEGSFDAATDEFIKVINFASTQSNIPYISIKVTGISRFGLLEKINSLMLQHENESIYVSYEVAIDKLSDFEKSEWEKVKGRLKKICENAEQKKVAVLVDAEESWIQEPVDVLTMMMMKDYNKNNKIVYNTFQLYRHDRLSFLHYSFEIAKQSNFILGAKLVRGAYMEKERNRALEMGYLSPIQLSKENTDKDYDSAIEFCIANLDKIAIIVASHNGNSNLLAANLLFQKGLPLNHQNIHFSQLYGMSDDITFNLAKHGFSVSKYLPFGPIKDVIPYLMRRAEENTSVAGQTGRELALLKKEMKRRKDRG
jgi:proline dehydrogenase